MKARLRLDVVHTVTWRHIRVVTSIALGAGIVALYLATRVGHHGDLWTLVGWIGFAFIMLSLPVLAVDRKRRHRALPNKSAIARWRDRKGR